MSGVSFGVDGYGVERECTVCGSGTQSHPAPNGYLCHTCLTERDESELLEDLPVAPIPNIDADSTVECRWCEAAHTLRDAHLPGRDVLRAGVGLPTFDSLTGCLFVSCPSCAKATEYLTSEAAAEALASDLGIDLMEYNRRRGWV